MSFAAPLTDNGDVPNSELEQLKIRANQVTHQSLQSTRHMLQLCEESKEAAIQTLVAIDDQGEKLDGIEENQNQINADMRQAMKNITEMEKCCGICVLPWKTGASFKEDHKLWKDNDDSKVISNQPQRVMTDERTGTGPQAGYISRITNDAREDEMEENMGQVHTMVGNFRNMALDMGSELVNQNNQIDRITNKVQSNKEMIKDANKRTGKLAN